MSGATIIFIDQDNKPIEAPFVKTKRKGRPKKYQTVEEARLAKNRMTLESIHRKKARINSQLEHYHQILNLIALEKNTI